MVRLSSPYGPNGGTGGATNQSKSYFKTIVFLFAVILAGRVIRSPRVGGGTTKKKGGQRSIHGDAPGEWSNERSHVIVDKSGSGGSGSESQGSTGSLRESAAKDPADAGQTETANATETDLGAYGDQYDEDMSVGNDAEAFRESGYVNVLSPLVSVPAHRMEYARYKNPEFDNPELLLYDKTTPHGMAFDFILNRDKRKISPDDPLLVQRFVLTLLFYATGGGDSGDPEDYTSPESGKRHSVWDSGAAHFLVPLHECHWAKKSLNDQFWALLSATGTNDGRVGVTKCNEEMEVTELRFADVNMVGFLPEEIKLLSSMTSLDLQSNHLAGPIPPGIAELTNLRYLSLDGNNFSGSIPNIFENLSVLEHAYLNFNDFNGAIPTSLCSLRDGGLLEDLWADCGGYPITCTCCTVCCNMMSECDEMASQKDV